MSSEKTKASQISINSQMENWDDDEYTNFVSPEKPSHLVEPEGFVYKVLSVGQLEVLQRDIIDNVKNVLDLSQQITRTILNHFKWDKERLLENYFESSPQEFFRLTHVLNPFEQERPNRTEPSNPSLDNTSCIICYGSGKKLMGLGCGHNSCAACWKQYLANKTYSEGQAQTIRCPGVDCGILVDYASFLMLADDPKVVQRYKQMITNFFVECNPLMRWCPAPNCTHAIEANYMEPKAVECKCGHQFCFGCGENWHEPASCGYLKKWLHIRVEDLETSTWINQNTKACPNCQVAIQKDGGCDHMICQNFSCYYEFCWMCLQSWKAHYSNCKLFEEKEDNRAHVALQVSRDLRDRYSHYKVRYMNQMKSMEMDQMLYPNVQAKVDSIQMEISSIELKFLRNGIDVLSQCRSTLMYSYVFAFYLKKNNQKIIFEDNLKDLEIATEKISDFLGKTIRGNNLYDIKKRIIELSQYCQQRRNVLLSHVREGTEEEWWDYIKETPL
ncbi:potential E3 ubiquitin-protein ligase ariadne-1-like [Drosophila serrata]|uniref:potential E3 ubiquitin-protein ligase ariadne-1-like n=1 Tax=Drosophila serrata TaxID=7274 RepID=UPI000A1D1888|nr:potential E3 ubiquitin-protein ligase ariadne-1-like [Drosophila serrata]